jgi:hypothetical protein
LERDRWYKSSQQTIKKEGVVMARLTEEQIANIERQADLAERKAAAEAKLAAQQPAWRIKEQQAQKDYYARMNQAHEQAMQRKRGFIESNPGSYSPWEKQAVDKYFKDKASEEQRIADNEHRAHEPETKETVAQYERDGKTGYGRDAAEIKAEADKYASDNQLKGVQAQAEAQREIEKGRLEFEKWKSGEAFKNADEASKREHGYWGENGEYHPGSRERTGRVTAEGRIATEIQRQQGRTDLQEKKNQGKLDQEKERSKGGILKAFASGFGVKIKDIADLMKKEGYSDEEIKAKMEEEGITLDEGEKRKEAEKHVSTGRNVARLINRFA